MSGLTCYRAPGQILATGHQLTVLLLCVQYALCNSSPLPHDRVTRSGLNTVPALLMSYLIGGNFNIHDKFAIGKQKTDIQ